MVSEVDKYVILGATTKKLKIEYIDFLISFSSSDIINLMNKVKIFLLMESQEQWFYNPPDTYSESLLLRSVPIESCSSSGRHIRFSSLLFSQQPRLKWVTTIPRSSELLWQKKKLIKSSVPYILTITPHWLCFTVIPYTQIFSYLCTTFPEPLFFTASASPFRTARKFAGVTSYRSGEIWN